MANFRKVSQQIDYVVKRLHMLKCKMCLVMASFGVFYMQAYCGMAFNWNVLWELWVIQRTFSSVIVFWVSLCMVTSTYVMYSKTQFLFTCNIWQWFVVVYLLDYTIFIGRFGSQHHLTHFSSNKKLFRRMK